MHDEIDWSSTTWEGSRRQQHRSFLALSFRQKLEVMEELSEVVELFAQRRRARGLTVSDPRSEDVGSPRAMPGRSSGDPGELETTGRPADSRPFSVRDHGSWPVRLFRLGAEPGNDLSHSTTAEQRLSMMWPLALEAWALSGRALPSHARKDTPVRRFTLSSLRER